MPSRPAVFEDAATVYLCWTGMETDLIFNKGVDLPGFAAFPLLDTEAGRARIKAYADDLIALARETGTGVILDSVTWMANADRAAPLGWGLEALSRINREAVAFARATGEGLAGVPALVSLQVGPRGDGYHAGRMTADEAQAYHAAQIEAGAEADPDLVSAYTLGSAGEAAGIVRAARAVDLPVVISFTVETDGRLADGATLAEAIRATDDATDGAAAGFYVNCAHPDHIAPALDGGPWMARLRGALANASRQSHAELDAATALDAGDPAEFGPQMAMLRARFPRLTVLGGCCGTDLRHMRATAQGLRAPEPA